LGFSFELIFNTNHLLHLFAGFQEDLKKGGEKQTQVKRDSTEEVDFVVTILDLSLDREGENTKDMEKMNISPDFVGKKSFYV